MSFTHNRAAVGRISNHQVSVGNLIAAATRARRADDNRVVDPIWFTSI
jgi:hypothetical protein